MGRATGVTEVAARGAGGRDERPATADGGVRFEARGLTKSYGPAVVLNGVDLVIEPGAVLALLGENGAGKSTLVNLLAGAARPDSGDLVLGGTSIVLKEPRDAIDAGIVHIPQELAYAPDLTVAENISLGAWPGRGPLVSRAKMRRRAAEQLDRLGVDLSPRRVMRTLRPAEQQLVEIAKALSRRASVLLLDEPTAALNAVESDRLFGIVAKLAQQRVAVAFISHRMDEVLEHSTAVVVLRNGRKTLDRVTSTVTEDELVRAMVGDVPHVDVEVPAAQELSGSVVEAVVRVKDLSREDIRLSLRPGEVLGLFGVRGSGCEAIIEGLAGASPLLSGHLEIDGTSQDLFSSTRAARAAGFLFVPAERKTAGLVMNQGVRFNVELLSLRRLSRAGVIRSMAGQREVAEMVTKLNIRCRSTSQKVGELSGGNQQKVLLASRLVVGGRCLLLAEPSRGVDVVARAEVHRAVRQTAASGVAVVVATSDVEECVTVSDRVVVVKDGRIVGTLTGSDRTQAKALALATGAQL